MSAAQIPSEILSILADGATILTPSQRPARSLRRAYDLHMQAAGETLWAPPSILALDTWLASLYTQLLATGEATSLVLNPTQELALWHTILADNQSAQEPQSPEALAAGARDAWHTLCLHNGRHRLDALTAPFQRWARAFDRVCTRHRYLTSAELPATLAAALARGALPLPNAGLALIDFDTLRPTHQYLVDSIARAGYPVQHLTTALPASTAALHTVTEEASELRAAAAWARDLIARDPTTRIAIVVPAQAALRPRLERVFAELLAPASAPITSTTPPPYEFSLGTPLAHTALAASALDLLRWTLEPLPLDRITALFLSPYFGPSNEAEGFAIAIFDARELRGRTILRPQLSLAEVTRRASGTHHHSLGSLPMRLRRLQQAAAQLSALPLRRTHSHWSELFSSLLDIAGWAAITQADSHAFQLRRRWQSALDELATLDFDGSTATAAEALDALARIVRAAIFAPESRDAPIQILGPLELGGTPFDALWFLSADDSALPPPLSANPLIPIHLQRELRMPGSDLAADRAAAALLTRRIARSAPHAVFSYAAEAESGTRRPSPLLRDLDLTPFVESPIIIKQPQPPEAFVDRQLIPPPPAATLRGGTTILELQAACPFRAFAERRLFSAEPESREPGLDPRERGNLVHEVMQLFWSQVQSQANLRALTTDARHTTLDACIEQALRKPAQSAVTPWDTAYLEVERRRLRSLLQPWLDEELRRPPFTVSASERTLSGVHVGPLHLDLRVDRIDIIGDPDDNQIAILDYKTGTARTTQWLTDRPEKPQLPLYAAVSPAPPAGIAFAVLKPGKDRKLEAFAADRGIFRTGARDDYEAQLDQWRETLTNLAQAFHNGDVRVDPRAYPQTCEHCGQRTLCRLDLTRVDDLSDEDDLLAEAEVSAE